MTVNDFINTNKIRPADAIVAKKVQVGLLKHYIIYLGFIEGDHRFMANYMKGVQLISSIDLPKLLGTYGPVALNRFTGNELERTQALQRAWSRRGEQEYDLILNNCEHYMNFVHKGTAKSDQVNDFGTGLLVAGGTLAVGGAASKNDNTVIGGLVLAGLGLITLLMEND